MSESFSNHEIYRGLKPTSELAELTGSLVTMKFTGVSNVNIRVKGFVGVLVTMKFTGASNPKQ